jgi:phosphoglycolate phosphatase
MNRIVPFDCVAFDLDGTLVDTGPDLTASLNHALIQLGRSPVPEASVRVMVGQGARKLLERGLAATGEANEALIDQGFTMFLDYYADHICDHSAPFDGIERAMDRLAESGVRLAICTNKPEALTLLLLDALGWRDRFVAVVGGDSLPQKKPDPAPLRATILRAGGGATAYVGDSITDTDTARAVGIPCVAVTFGFADRPHDQLGANALIDHFDQLIPALQRLG